jgi:exonuclease SbcC
VQHHLARLTALLPSQQLAAAERRDLEAGRVRSAAAQRELREVSDRCEQVPSEIEQLTRTLSAVAISAARTDRLEAALATARERHRAAVLLDTLEPEVSRLEEARRDARDARQDAREHVQALVSRRLSGMAAELAGALVDGMPCQVCGSTDHPDKAAPARDAVTDLDHDRAEQQLALAGTALEEAEQALAATRRRQDALRAACDGLPVSDAAVRVEELDGELSGAVAARAEQAVLQERLRRLHEEQTALGDRRSSAAAAAARLQESVAAHERRLAAVERELADALGESLCLQGAAVAAAEHPAAALQDETASLGAAIDVWTRWRDRLTDAGRAIADDEEAEARAAALTEQAAAVVSRHGFPGVESVLDVVLDADVRARLHQHLEDRRVEQARVGAVLDDLAVADVDASPGTDVSLLAAELVEAESASAADARDLALVEDVVTSLTALLARLETALADWAPVREEFRRADSVARLVKGMGHDNQLQMRLSSYVLATRLDQVVGAANERLGHLRDHRYLLQRTGRAERRSAQAGLGLEVVDQWTGEVRSPSTLSGGETFVVSLSLALGLADVVTHEAGGTEVETLFVDEGFGSLDADTLDDVMDRLDGLRAGGRTVGVVSHVTELRSRIPTQVHVDKGRSGSTVAVLATAR